MALRNINLIYFPGCPHFRKTCDLICEIVQKNKLNVILKLESVNNDNFHLFQGSPTVLVDGIDIEECYTNKKLSSINISNDSLDQTIFFCRIYDCAVSKGCPSVEMLNCSLL